MTAFRDSSFDTLHTLQRGLLRLYSLLLLFLGKFSRFLPPFFSTFSFVFILFSSVITVAPVTGSKPGISTHPVPSELRLDAGGEGESVCVRVRSRGGECAPLVVDPTLSQQPSAWEVELGDQRPSLRPRELRVSSVYLLALRRNRSWT